MSRPISVTTISADTPLPEQHDYTLNLKVKVSTFDEALDKESFTYMLNSLLDDWMDGRRPFEVEMIHNGLYRCLKRAAYDVVCKQTQDEFGNEMVVSEDGSRQTARWHLEAAGRKPVVPDFDNLTVDITID